MFTGLSAPTICEIDEMNAVGVDDSKSLSAVLWVRAHIGRVVAKLEGVTCLPER